MYTVPLDRRAHLRLAMRCSAIVIASIVFSSLFNTALNRLMWTQWTPLWIGPMVAICVGLGWFVVTFAWGELSARAELSSRREPLQRRADVPQQPSAVVGSIGIAAIIGAVLAISAWLALEVNDALFYTRNLPWVRPLIWLQEVGFRTTARLFPCIQEGLDVGCEVYKRLPAFLFSNALVCSFIVWPAVILSQRQGWSRSGAPRAFSPIARWGSVVGFVVLYLRFVIYALWPDISSPPPSSIGSHVPWVVLDGAAGWISVLLVLMLPFYVYRATAAIWKSSHFRERMIDLTWVVAFLFAALMVGNQFSR